MHAALSWYFIFSKPDYQVLKKHIENSAKLIEKWKRSGKDEKRRERMESDLKVDNAKLAAMKVYNLVFLGAIMIGWYQALKYYFDGQIVATLPFTPISLLQKLFQAGLTNPGPRDCSMVILTKFFHLFFQLFISIPVILGYFCIADSSVYLYCCLHMIFIYASCLYYN